MKKHKQLLISLLIIALLIFSYFAFRLYSGADTFFYLILGNISIGGANGLVIIQILNAKIFLNAFILDFVHRKKLKWLSKYKYLECTIDDVEFKLLSKISHFKKEGAIMKHCLKTKSYYNSVLDGRNVVFSVVDNKNEKNRATIEICSAISKTYCTQAKSYNNHFASEKIQKVIAKFCHVNNISIKTSDIDYDFHQQVPTIL